MKHGNDRNSTVLAVPGQTIDEVELDFLDHDRFVIQVRESQDKTVPAKLRGIYRGTNFCLCRRGC